MMVRAMASQADAGNGLAAGVVAAVEAVEDVG
jgi:hypothetical protein